MYRPFHKNLPRSSAFVNWISARFYETDCILCILYGVKLDQSFVSVLVVLGVTMSIQKKKNIFLHAKIY